MSFSCKNEKSLCGGMGGCLMLFGFTYRRNASFSEIFFMARTFVTAKKDFSCKKTSTDLFLRNKLQISSASELLLKATASGMGFFFLFLGLFLKNDKVD